MMRQAVHRHCADAERSGCRLEASIEGDVFGLLDELAIEQIADNLLSNAVKYFSPAFKTVSRHSLEKSLFHRSARRT